MGILKEIVDGKEIKVVINSTNLNSAIYDTGTRILTIVFKNGSIYEYEDVPWNVFTKLRMSDSQGKFFSKEIKNSYKFKKL